MGQRLKHPVWADSTHTLLPFLLFLICCCSVCVDDLFGSTPQTASFERIPRTHGSPCLLLHSLASHCPSLPSPCLLLPKRTSKSKSKYNALALQIHIGGKICAALDRQHPRDLFDVKRLLENEGITDDVKDSFLFYQISRQNYLL